MIIQGCGWCCRHG